MPDLQKWRSQGNCRNLDAASTDQIFFPENAKKATKRAVLMCSSCPVKAECLNFALTYGEDGLWAATTASERRLMLGLVSRRDLLRRAQDQGTLETREHTDWLPKLQPLQPPVELQVAPLF